MALTGTINRSSIADRVLLPDSNRDRDISINNSYKNKNSIEAIIYNIINNNNEITEIIKESSFRSRLEYQRIIEASREKYLNYIESEKNYINLNKLYGYLGDISFLLYILNPIKNPFIRDVSLYTSLILKSYYLILEQSNVFTGIKYGFKTGHIIDTLKNTLRTYISFIPGLTYINKGISYFAKRSLNNEIIRKIRKLYYTNEFS